MRPVTLQNQRPVCNCAGSVDYALHCFGDDFYGNPYLVMLADVGAVQYTAWQVQIACGMRACVASCLQTAEATPCWHQRAYSLLSIISERQKVHHPVCRPPEFLSLLAVDRQVIIFDYPGLPSSPDSSSSAVTIEYLAFSTIELIRALKLEKPDLLGWVPHLRRDHGMRRESTTRCCMNAGGKATPEPQNALKLPAGARWHGGYAASG